MKFKVSQSCQVTLWAIQSMKFSRPEYWSGKPFPYPVYLPNPGIELGSSALQADSLPTEISYVQLFATPWTAAPQAPLPMGFPREEYWSGLPFFSPRDLCDPGIKTVSPALSSVFFTLNHQESPTYVF